MELSTTFYLADAPRRVPMSLRLKLLLGGIGQMGWFLLGFGMIFVWTFVAEADYGFVTFRGEKATTTGRITRIEKTRASEGGDEHTDGTPIYRYWYAYEGPDGREHEAAGYAVGRGAAEGSEVRVQYLERDPGRSRAIGYRRAPFGAWAAFVLVFPVVGLGMLLSRWQRGWKGVRLLARGDLALGRLTSKERTNTVVNDKRVYRLTFEFTAQDGTRQRVVARTTEPEKLEDEEAERVLHDPRRPSFAVLMDSLPGSPEVDERGQFKGARRGAWLLLALPLSTLVGHGVWGWTRFAG